MSSFARKRETEGKTPRITPDKKKAISNMKQRNKIPGLPSSVKYQILDFLFIHYIREKIAKQSNSNNKKHTKQASREKKPKH